MCFSPFFAPHRDTPSRAPRRGRGAACPGRAFTLIELLVVISIIALLVGLLLPVLRNARDSARSGVCLSYTRQIGIAIQMYAQDSDDYLPLYLDEIDPAVRKYWHLEALASYLNFQPEPVTGPPWIVDNPLADVYMCPADQAIFEVGGNNSGLEPSYGYNTLMGVGGDHSDYLGGDYEYWRLFNIENPSEKIIVADSGHLEEDGGRAFTISRTTNTAPGKTLPRGSVAPRHNEGSYNIAWVDGHAEVENMSPWDLIALPELWLPVNH
jgi:prepilin-type N-terminal cleavage/methylation domain-containing protein/prepilin-type processing-associated H-X9-DG protein